MFPVLRPSALSASATIGDIRRNALAVPLPEFVVEEVIDCQFREDECASTNLLLARTLPLALDASVRRWMPPVFARTATADRNWRGPAHVRSGRDMILLCRSGTISRRNRRI